MGILEIVFNSRKFDLNDDVLMGFDNYFDKKSKDYNSFCLDEEDINPLQNFVAQIKSADSDSVIYVSTYGYEITNSKGEKSTYADALWIDTVLPISQIERYIEKSGVAEPSNISFVGDSDECGNYKVLHANFPFVISLYLLKSVPMTFATDGIKNLSMLIPKTLSVMLSLFRVSISRIWFPKIS